MCTICRLYTILGVLIFPIIAFKSTTNRFMSRKLYMQDVKVDVAVIGGGPAGSALAYLLQEQQGCDVALIDPQGDRKTGTWYANYGEWREEWEALVKRLQLPEMRACTTHEWEVTDCYFGGSHNIPVDKRTRLDRAYVRLDRLKLQYLLRSRFDDAGGKVIVTKLNSKRIASNLFDKNLVHDASGSTLTLDDGSNVRCKIIVDASGFESPLVAREDPMLARGNPKELPTGYQIAYGFTALVDNPGPYAMEAMTLFDYRTTHFASGSDEEKDGCNRPTFMYAMPMETIKTKDGDRYKIFFEETSLVGRDERRLTFKECKKRAMKRLAFYNMKVIGIEEEEYCYIPMGGELPDLSQRIIAFGGAANMVHPSTGYQACRMLAASTDVAIAIGKGLHADNKKFTPDKIAADAYAAMWSTKTREQRDFQAYGGEFLMIQSVEQLRGFFSAFFAVPMEVWGGFLAGWPGLPHNTNHETWNARLLFALSLFLKMPNSVRLAMIVYSMRYTFEFGPGTLLRSLTPAILTGEGPRPVKWKAPIDKKFLGDYTAKDEAKEMMAAFKPDFAVFNAIETGSESETATGSNIRPTKNMKK
jgi:lycopene beta-cyclase